MIGELLSVRFLLDASVKEVGDAVAKSLLHGRPPEQKSSGGWPMMRAPSGLLMPWPIASEWEEATVHLPIMMNPETVFQNGVNLQEKSFSMGLRPLVQKDSICAGPRRHGYRISLHSGFSSSINTTETTERAGERSFRTVVSSMLIAAAANNVIPESQLAAGAVEEGGQNSSISLEFTVRSVGGGRRCELIRQLYDRSPLTDAATFGPSKGENEHAAARLLRMVAFMLEMEVRAWCQCLSFPVVEVWRGARCTQDWASATCLLIVGSYVFCTGHSASTASEKKLGPSFDEALLRRLSSELPTDPPAAQAQRCRTQFIEGNVQIESFAALLDRVCRRADEAADIFRCFVDLGSGPGLAVLTAHLLFPFRRCVGCELQSRVAKSAREMARRYTRNGLAALARSKGCPKELVREGDFLQNLDWSDASVVFANAVTWPKDVIKAVGQQALRLQRGAVLLLAARQLPVEQSLLEAFDVRGEACLMSFTDDAVSIWAYQRR